MSESMYTTGGTVAADNPLYVDRSADTELLVLCRAREYAYILTARQLGKSSLMLRTSIRLRQEEVQTAIVDLQRIGKQAVTAPQWFSGLLREITRGLRLEVNLLAWWQQHEYLGMAQRLALFFEDLVIKQISSPIVVFIDEIDTTIGLSFSDDFFVAIRALYEARSQNPDLKRLSFVLIGTASPGDLISDPKRTPFNIGRRVDLTDFRYEEAQLLADGLGLPAKRSRQVLRHVMEWTHGHPYLTQRLCRAIADSGQSRWSKARIDVLVANTFFGDKSRQDSNLEYVRNMLLKPPDPPGLTEVLTTYQAVRQNRRVTDEQQSLVNLSDGGHTGDNVGIYPLLERRCQVIIACDAEADAGLSFGSFTEALRHAYVDMGVDVDIDLSMIRPDPVTKLSKSHCAIGRVRYPECPDRPNWLIYLKNSLTGDEPAPVMNYRTTCPDFPHESTADQFFDDAQFESYRALGSHIAEETFAAWAGDPRVLAALLETQR